MSEILYDRLKENLEALKMRNTLEIIDNYLERAIKEELNIVDVLDHIFSEEARGKLGTAQNDYLPVGAGNQCVKRV